MLLCASKRRNHAGFAFFCVSGTLARSLLYISRMSAHTTTTSGGYTIHIPGEDRPWTLPCVRYDDRRWAIESGDLVQREGMRVLMRVPLPAGARVEPNARLDGHKEAGQ